MLLHRHWVKHRVWVFSVFYSNMSQTILDYWGVMVMLSGRNLVSLRCATRPTTLQTKYSPSRQLRSPSKTVCPAPLQELLRKSLRKVTKTSSCRPGIPGFQNPNWLIESLGRAKTRPNSEAPSHNHQVAYALVPQPVRVQWDPKGSGSFWSDRCSIRSGSCDFGGLSMTKSFHHFIFNDPLRCCYQTRLTKIFM